MAYKASISKAWKSVAKHGEHTEMESGKAVEDAKTDTEHTHTKVVEGDKVKILTQGKDGEKIIPGNKVDVVSNTDYFKSFNNPKDIAGGFDPSWDPKGPEFIKWSKTKSTSVGNEPKKINIPGATSLHNIPSSTEGSSGESQVTTTTGGLVDVPEPWQVRQQGRISNKLRNQSNKEAKKALNRLNKITRQRGEGYIDQEVAGGNKEIMDLLKRSGGYNPSGRKNKGFLGLGGKSDFQSTTSDRQIDSGKKDDLFTTDIDESKTNIEGIKQRSSYGESVDSGHSINPYNLNPGQYGVQYDKYGKKIETTTTVPDSSKDVAATQSDFTIYNPETHGKLPKGTMQDGKWTPINDVNDTNGDDIASLSGYDGNIGVTGDVIGSMAARIKGNAVAKNRKGKHAKNKYGQTGPNWHNS